MATLGKTIFFVSVICFVTAGCNEQQLKDTDRFVDKTQDTVAGGEAVLQSPAGDLVPEPFKSISALALLLMSAGVNVYQKWRTNELDKKYTAMKSGQAQLKLSDPEAEARLYALVGAERAAKGL